MSLSTVAPGPASDRAPQLSILVVDDEDDLRAAIRRDLKASIAVREAASGEEALELLRHTPIDAVIADFNMPRMNGLDLLQRVRLTYPHVGRIMLSGTADIRVAIRGLNEGAVHRFLLKPWQGVDLQTIVRLVLATDRRA